MRVALGVGGGIAAYKAAELARALEERGCAVQVVMTRAAQQFITPLTFAALTNRKVITDLFAERSSEEILSSAVEHIRVAEEHDLLVVAPATADLIAKFAHGLADDFLSTLYLAFERKIVLAPAMNTAMWRHPATKANLAVLRERGVHIIEPGDGRLACGTVGVGRLAEPAAIADEVARLLAGSSDLSGETVLITAGPTQEPIDPVRFLSNRSSGKMGYALAEAALARGARVVLVSGPVALTPPAGAIHVPVRTARQMHDAVMEHLGEATIIIKTAAVADYHVTDVPKEKVKKTAARWTVDLEPTPDILAEVGRKKDGRLLIGFAAETGKLVEEARRKLQSKNCDMVVANLVSTQGIGFESDENEVTLVMRDGQTIELPRAAKRHIADQILNQVSKLRLGLHARG